MLAKTQEEKLSGYSGSLRTYSIRQVPDTSSGSEGGMSETFWKRLGNLGLKISILKNALFAHTDTHSVVSRSEVWRLHTSKDKRSIPQTNFLYFIDATCNFLLPSSSFLISNPKSYKPQF